MERRLAADVVGYSRLMEADKVGTLAALRSSCKTILVPLVAQLCGLERRAGRNIRNSVDHAPHAHNDLINAVAGAIVEACRHGRSALSVDAMAGVCAAPAGNLRGHRKVGIGAMEIGSVLRPRSRP